VTTPTATHSLYTPTGLVGGSLLKRRLPKVAVLGISDLRTGTAADAGRRTSLSVHVEVEGKGDSKSSSPSFLVIPTPSPSRPGSSGGACAVVSCAFAFESELRGWVAGESAVFTVTDWHGTVLGRATVTTEQVQQGFEGDLRLLSGGEDDESYPSLLKVRIVAPIAAPEPAREATDPAHCAEASDGAAARPTEKARNMDGVRKSFADIGAAKKDNQGTFDTVVYHSNMGRRQGSKRDNMVQEEEEPDQSCWCC